MNNINYVFPNDKSKKLKDYDPSLQVKFETKKEANKHLKKGIQKLSDLQEKLYAFDQYALLIVFQAMDAAGKDGTIKHVMSGVNPQGCRVVSFKAPSSVELNHDYLWRCMKELPQRGKIGIFNRSYYEEVLVARVHSDILIHKQKIPGINKDSDITEDFWQTRFRDINNFEKYLRNNGTHVLKFFLNVSKEEQKNRFLKRIDRPSKNWKISINDYHERKYWDNYMFSYEQMLLHTSTEHAPWYVIPANYKWYMRAMVCDIIVSKLESFNVHFPVVSEEQKKNIIKARDLLINEE